MASQGWLSPRVPRLRNVACAIGLAAGCLVALLVNQTLIIPKNRKLAKNRSLLERHEKLESLSILTAGFAHEIRNPLNSIKARLFTQKKLLRPKTEEREDNKFISDEISRLNEIIEQFLGFAKPGEPQLSTIQASEPILVALQG